MLAPLPIRDGVAPSYLWLPPGSWPDMLSFLTAHFHHVNAATWIDRMQRGEVRFADGTVILPATAYRRGHCIFYYREIAHETPIPFAASILYQDAHVLVADKPHFLPVTPGGRFVKETLLVRLKHSTGLSDLVPIHRLDRETAGVVIFSHNPATRGRYQSMFQQRVMRKLYHALAPIVPGLTWPLKRHSRIEKGEPFFRMMECAGTANAETEITLLEQQNGLGLFALRPHTGRQHQLRVHMAALGMPIVNDDFYPHALPCKQDDVSRPLQLLAKQITFVDPLSGVERSFESGRNLAFPMPLSA